MSHPVSPELEQAIGRFVAGFAALEHVLWQQAPKLLGRSETEMGQLLADNPAFGPRLTLVEEMAIERGPELAAVLQEIRGKARFRAALIHGRLQEEGSGGRVHALPTYRAESDPGVVVTPDVLAAEHGQLLNLGRKLIDLSQRGANSTSPRP
jgi:hypothetical protein